jgi:hypothetical protein
MLVFQLKLTDNAKMITLQQNVIYTKLDMMQALNITWLHW